MNNLNKVISFYCFASIRKGKILEFRDKLFSMANNDLTGLIIIAEEGINGTICGGIEIVDYLIREIKIFFNNDDLNEKVSFSEKKIFKKLKVKFKSEIVTMGVTDIKPNRDRGSYLQAIEWNKLIQDEETLIIDTRNNYEVSLGSFRNSINPNTNTFREFPYWAQENLAKHIKSKKTSKIALFCTGGIRCEKATSFLKSRGYKNIYHLKGGILKYLEYIDSDENLYDGECYVFDDRVSLNKYLRKGSYSICHACGMPISNEDKNKDEYIEGIQCHLCIEKFNDHDRKRFEERQKQFDKKRKKLNSI